MAVDLATLADKRDLSLHQAIWIVIQTCEALKHVHDCGLVHREIKPSNIVVSEQNNLHVTLLDSGIARHENPAVDALTNQGVFVGDLKYAAPEQVRKGHHVGQRADIYAVVAVLYELITHSSLPFPIEPEWQPGGARSSAPNGVDHRHVDRRMLECLGRSQPAEA